MKSNRLRVILLLGGLSALAGCAVLEKIQTVADVVILDKAPANEIPANCPPILPDLPGVNEQDTVVLYPKDLQALLLYFHQVERCYSPSAQGTGL